MKQNTLTGVSIHAHCWGEMGYGQMFSKNGVKILAHGAGPMPSHTSVIIRLGQRVEPRRIPSGKFRYRIAQLLNQDRTRGSRQRAVTTRRHEYYTTL